MSWIWVALKQEVIVIQSFLHRVLIVKIGKML